MPKIISSWVRKSAPTATWATCGYRMLDLDTPRSWLLTWLCPIGFTQLDKVLCAWEFYHWIDDDDDVIWTLSGYKWMKKWAKLGWIELGTQIQSNPLMDQNWTKKLIRGQLALNTDQKQNCPQVYYFMFMTTWFPRTWDEGRTRDTIHRDTMQGGWAPTFKPVSPFNIQPQDVCPLGFDCFSLLG